MTEVVLPLFDEAASPFDDLRHVESDGSERWYGRELMPAFEYASWNKFAIVINKAKDSLAKVEGVASAEHHFPKWESDGGRWAGGKVEDFRLTRFGAYLTAMAGDDTKLAVAQARVYFAVKTREAEVRQPATQATEIDLNDLHAIARLGQAAERAAMRAIAAEARTAELETHVAELEPKAAQADHHRAADGQILVGDFANKLKAFAKRQHGVRIKHDEVWDFLGNINLLIRGNTLRHNQPTAFAIERDYVRVKESEYDTNTRGAQVSATPRLTPTGEGYAWDRAVKRITAHGSLAHVKTIEGTSR